jgi:phosphoglycolate phosphatase (TIGR01487 family)
MVAPLAVDIDGTLTTPDGRIDPRAVERLHQWEDDIVLATGMSFPYPVVLCRFLGLPKRVVAENGGVVYVDDETHIQGSHHDIWTAIDEYVQQGGSLAWGKEDPINRWRVTEAVLSPDADETLLRDVARENGLTVVFTGYAYHVKTPNHNKGSGLRTACEILGRDPDSFIAIGDSANDVEMFELVENSFALANADEDAREAAGTVLDESFMDGVLSVLDIVE